MTANLAHEFAKSLGLTVQQAQIEYDGICIEFAGEFVDSDFGKNLGARMPYFDDLSCPFWKYHCTVQVGDMIHDLWEHDAIPIADYMAKIGATRVEYPAENGEQLVVVK